MTRALLAITVAVLLSACSDPEQRKQSAQEVVSMSTIANRLREIAGRIENGCYLLGVFEDLTRLATELEAAPAADAVPVMAQISTSVHPSGVPSGIFWFAEAANLQPSDYLVRHSDHLSAIAALQAQIAELQATPHQIYASINDIVDACKEFVAASDEARFSWKPATMNRVNAAEKRLMEVVRSPNPLIAIRNAPAAAPSTPTTQPPEGRDEAQQESKR